MPATDTLLIYAPVALHRSADGALLLERQAINGLRLWAANFERVIAMCPLSPDTPRADWDPVTDLGPDLERIRIEPLPMAYRPDKHFREVGGVRDRISDLIDEARYLSFAIGGYFGDWGAVACDMARRKGRDYAVWTDRVESAVVRQSATHGPWRRRLKARLIHRPMARLERRLIRNAKLGLFHGRETFETYAPYCRQPELVHDIHIKPDDHIPPAALAAKLARGEGPLRVIYAGRADAMKGPFDWLDVLGRLKDRGVAFHATWLGDGDCLADMRTRVREYRLGAEIDLPGFTQDRARVLEALRAADLFLFCHKTPESPRCLIEALISATPIVGYGDAYAADLIAENGGGQLVTRGDIGALTDAVADLATHRPQLQDLTVRAAKDGAPFDDVSVFQHRSALIKRYLR